MSVSVCFRPVGAARLIIGLPPIAVAEGLDTGTCSNVCHRLYFTVPLHAGLFIRRDIAGFSVLLALHAAPQSGCVLQGTGRQVQLLRLPCIMLCRPCMYAGALEIGGGPTAELVIASSALRAQWKDARAALQTSRNMVAMLEQEYKESREWAAGH